MDIKNQFTCFLIGEGTLPIQCAELLLERGHQVKGSISFDALVSQWAKAKEIPHIQPTDNLVAFLSQQPFDYLFSIVNDFLLPKEILELPRKEAINYHDALLPKYAGVNATSWALMHREKTHGITWHVMTNLVDSGDILKQVSIDIASDETAFTLNGKCYEAAICSFAQLIDELSSGQVLVSKQNLDERTYFPRYKRPRAGGVFSFNRCAHDIDAFVRALNFGPYPNSLGLAKLVIGSSSLIVSKLEVLDDQPKFPPGTVTAIEPSFLKVSTANYSVALHQVLTSDGQELSIPDVVARFGLQVGYRFKDIEPDMVRRIERFDALIAKHEAFWVKRLTTLQPITIPYAQRTASHLKSKHYASVKMPVLHKVTTFLEKRHPAWNQGDFLEAAFVAYLARIGGTRCFDIGFRDIKLHQEMVGLESLFASHVPCRVDIEYEQSFEEVFEAFRKQVELTKLHLTYARDVVARYPAVHSLSQTDCEQMFPVVVERVEKLDDYQAGSGNELSLVIPLDGKECVWFYNTEALDGDSIARMQDQFTIFLQGIVTEPAQRIAYLPLLSEQEHHKILVEWNNTKVEYVQDKCIHQLFEEQVELTPDTVAVMLEDEHLTYRELNCRANQLAHYLQSLGVRPEVLVGICVERSLLMIVGLLGILKAGGAYVPLDPAYPSERLAYMLSDSGVSVLLTQEKLASSLPVTTARVIYLDSDWPNIGDRCEENPLKSVKASNLAYVIYTSGSTGKPKGVMIEHRSVVNFTSSAKAVYKITQSDRVLQFASIAFDAAVMEIFPCLSAGGTLVLRTDEMLVSGSRFVQRCREWEVTMIAWMTSHWHQVMVELAAAQQILPESLRVVDVGGEAVLPKTLKLWQRCVKGLANPPQLLNGYGPTEATAVATYYDLSEFIANNPAASCVPIGTPIGNVTTYVLDGHLQPAPIGVPGELHIGGTGLARGYLGRKEVTAEKFIPNPFTNEASARLYKTGDLVRYNRDGSIEFLGRIDNQVKIRGFRIELGEIEAAIAQHPAVRETVVVAREDVPNRKYLAAYIVPNQSEAISTGNLHGFLSEKLPDYMIPGAFVMLDALPLTPNGKVDRRALRAPELHLELEASFVAPRTPIEEMLASIWASVLSIELVGVHHNFFELGGHSLLATQVISRVRDTFAIELPLRSLFEAPTIAEFALIVENALSNGQSQEAEPLVPIPRSESIPLSFTQARLWFLDQLQPNSAFYNIPFAWRLSGQLNIEALQGSINEIIRRHEALRTNFTIQEGQPVALIAATLNCQLQVVNLLHIRESDREIEAQRLALVEANRPFNLEREPLLRSMVLHLGETEYVLLFTMHHIISDGWSLGVFTHELTELYKAFCTGVTPVLPSLPVQYADFALWMRQWLQGEILEAQLDYWKQQLKNAPALLELPTDRPRATEQTYRGGYHYTALSLELSGKVSTLSKRTGVTLFMTLYAAFVTLLSRITSSDDIVVGTPVASRHRQEIEGLIGFFVNTLVLRTYLGDNPSFEELLGRVREVALGAYTHQDLPFEQLVEALQPERSLSYTPLFQVMFALQNAPMPSMALPNLTISSYSVEIGTSKFDLTLSMENTADGLVGVWEYNSDLFDEVTIARMSRHFQTLLEAIAANPNQTISELPLLTQVERHQLLFEWNNTTTEYPGDKCIHQLFEQQVELTPDAIAVVFEDKQWTYLQLNQRANKIAHYLQTLGVEPEVLVGICVERSLEMIVGLFGIFKAGAAYVPLDPAYPKDRLSHMLLDSQVSVVLTTEKLVAQLPEHTAPVVCLDTDWDVIEQMSEENPLSNVQAHNLAYVIYTSGSTGKPKGITIEHRSVLNLATGLHQAIYAHYQDSQLRVSVNGSLSFDTSVKQIIQLLYGHTLEIVPQAVRFDGNALLSFLQKHKIDVFDCTPSQLEVLIAAGMLASQSAPKAVLVGGEKIDSSTWLALRTSENINFYNVYGPTECTVDATVCLVKMAGSKPVIGRPIANTQIYILDRHLQPVGVGVAGELYIGGHALARGYLNRPDLTSEKFIPNPFNNQPGSRLYKTGDKARYLPDGNIEFLGRIDHQVKIRGFRIELGEIEAALASHFSVQETVVVAREDIPGRKYLAAYIVSKGSNAPTLRELRGFLKQILPDYMIPGAFVILDALPLTPNGKVDRKALPIPPASNDSDRLVLPRTSNEEILAGIWKDVLGLKLVGIHDNFFELGGDSIISIQIIARTHQANLHLTVKDLFQHQTIAELAQIVTPTTEIKAEQGLVTGLVPLTPIQQRFVEQNLPEPHHFNQSFLFEISPDLKPELLQQVLQHLLHHHDALRLRLIPKGDTWQLVNASTLDSEIFSIIDLSQIAPTEQIAALETTANQLQASLNLCDGPIIRATLFHLGSHQPNRLLIIIHHLAVDGVSWRILLEDLITAYQQLGRGETIQLPAKTTSFQDWAVRLTQYAQTQTATAVLDYWLTQLDCDIAPLPVDYPAFTAFNQITDTAEVSVFLSTEQTTALLKEVPKAYNTQINDALLSALVQSFAQWTGQTSLLIDLEGHGREELFPDVNLSRTVGWFTSIFPVLLKLEQAEFPGKSLKFIKEQLRRIPQRGIGYGIIRYLGEDETTRHQLQQLPQAQVSFNYLGQFDQMLSAFPILGLAQESSGSPVSLKGNCSHLLQINGLVADGKLQLSWAYNTKLHTRATVERLANSFIESLTAIIDHCLSPEAGGYTPTDFPDADLTQAELDELVESLTPKTQIESIYPLSPMQEGMLFHTLYAPDSGVYFEQFVFTLSGNLQVWAFEQAWRRVVELHPVLRTLFIWKNRQYPLQVVCRSVNLPWTNYDWRSLSSGEQEERLSAFLQTQRERGFELDKAPLMCCTLIQVADNTYQFVWSHHHLLMDGWCWPIVLKQVWAFYEAINRGENLYLDAPPPYLHYITWRRQQDREAAQEFWRSTLAGFTAPTPFGVDKPVGNLSEQKDIYDKRDIQLSATLTDALKEFARQNHLTLNTLVQGAWALLLSRYSGESDVVFGATVSGRPPALLGVESMVGLFINTLPVRVQISPETELLSWLKQLQVSQVEREQYSYSPLVDIQGVSEVPRNSPLFNSIVVLENYPVDASLLEAQGSVKISNVRGFERTNYPMNVAVVPGRELSIQISYDTSRFDDDTVSRMLGHLQTLLSGIVNYPSGRVGELSLLTPFEKQQLLVEWNDTASEYPQDKCIHQLFEEQVELHPDAIAVVFEEEQLTYRELNQRANCLAHHLKTLGVGPEVLVGICVERSLEMIVGLLGILKAGGAYMPLDPAYPCERLAFMLSDAQIPVVLTQERLLDELPSYGAQVVCLDSNWQDIAQGSKENPRSGVAAENLAYVIYTSGSTGKPKGVTINHRNVLALLHGFEQVATRVEPLISTFVCPYSFDLSVWEIFSNLCFGGTLHILLPEIFANPENFASYLINHHVTTTYIPPALLSDVATELEKQSNSITLNRILVGVEPIKQGILQRFLHMSPAIRIVNGYGPTETTICATFYNFCDVTDEDRRTPIGTAVQNYIVYIFDHHLQPVPIGVPGELYIGGAGLARGYLNRPDLTQEKFISNPFSNQPSSRLYKTGDLARYLPDGNIEYLGRIDNQVKIRGFRIELGEIETALALHPAVQETVVVAREDIPGDKRLVAYIVPIQVPPTYQELRDFLLQKLPSYMVPNAIVVLSTMPLTSNGKVDRRALPAPDSSPSDSRSFVPPRDTVEQQLQRIWSEVLQLSTIGVHDNFFELGGHSLLAVRLMARLEQHFGLNLPLATLLATPTIEQLASCLRASPNSCSWSPLVAIQSSGDKKPFFCVPGVGGNVIYLYELARHLGLDQPFYGFSAKGLDGSQEPLIRVEDIAAYYIEAMQTLQPRGPYLLGGHSFGGVVAFEMAIQLGKMGHEVALVAIIDALAPIVDNKPNCSAPEEAANLFDFASYIESMFSLNLEVSKETLADLTASEQLHYLKERLIRVNLLPPDTGIKLVRGLVQVYMASLKAHRSYLPKQVLPTRIALLSAQDIDEREGDIEEHLMMRKEPTLGWKEMSGTVDVHLVPGNHMTMMQKPQVQVLAEQLQVALEQAQTYLAGL
ncbi:MAG TPA: amino acid adenylation domain-containing protein [Stenomitos sp.]